MCPKAPERTSMFTKILAIMVGVTLTAGPCALTTSARGAALQQGSLRKVVQHLGLPGNKNLADVRRLAETPHASVGLLVAEIHTVSNPQRTVVGYGSVDINHLIWVIAALRYMTGGMDLCAPTSHTFGKSGDLPELLAAFRKQGLRYLLCRMALPWTMLFRSPRCPKDDYQGVARVVQAGCCNLHLQTLGESAILAVAGRGDEGGTRGAGWQGTGGWPSFGMNAAQ